MPSTYRLGINMAGAISAGAYTAGVLDFLVEAIDVWEAAKAAGEPVPQHDLSVEILTGASAGGMCAALGSLSLFDKPNPCPGFGETWSNPTRLYDAWVNQIRIEDLVSTGDLDALEPDGSLTALLNSTTLQNIAKSTLGPARSFHRRESVSATLRLLLTLTNLRGIPYTVNSSNAGTFFERTPYYADQIQFSFDPQEGQNPVISGIVDVQGTDHNASPWPELRRAAIASGAVPLMLAPQIIPRNAADYESRDWTISVDPEANPCTPGTPCECERSEKIKPAWDTPAKPFDVVYVDGGATNNDPFECARRYLAGLDGRGHNERDPMKATASVLTIAPFPGDDGFSPAWDARANTGLIPAMLALKQVLIGQSRFQGESLSLGQDPNVASRYAVVPKDETAAEGQPAIQSASLGAFGGFFSRAFREHDYHLGRYNCQRFLKEWFVLPCENPLIEAGLPDASRKVLIASFQANPEPGGTPRRGPATLAWMPIIPLCRGLDLPLKPPAVVKMTPAELGKVLDLAFARVKALLGVLAKKFLKGFAWLVPTGIIANSLRKKVEPKIREDLSRCRCY